MTSDGYADCQDSQIMGSVLLGLLFFYDNYVGLIIIENTIYCVNSTVITFVAKVAAKCVPDDLFIEHIWVLEVEGEIRNRRSYGDKSASEAEMRP